MKQYYKRLSNFLELANRKSQIEYLLNAVNRERSIISVYGPQIVKNSKISELDQIEEKAKSKLVKVQR